jgi:hypothetical protein
MPVTMGLADRDYMRSIPYPWSKKPPRLEPYDPPPRSRDFEEPEEYAGGLLLSPIVGLLLVGACIILGVAVLSSAGVLPLP